MDETSVTLKYFVNLFCSEKLLRLKIVCSNKDKILKHILREFNLCCCFVSSSNLFLRNVNRMCQNGLIFMQLSCYVLHVIQK